MKTQPSTSRRRAAVAALILASAVSFAPGNVHAMSGNVHTTMKPQIPMCGTSAFKGPVHWHSGAGTLTAYHNTCNNTIYATIYDSNTASNWGVSVGNCGPSYPAAGTQGQNYLSGGGGSTASVTYGSGCSTSIIEGQIDGDKVDISY